MKLNLIAAVCENQGIGINGVLPWNLKGELRHFNRITKLKLDPKRQNVVIMGRKTYFGIPEDRRPLVGRINIILTRNLEKEKYSKDVILCSSLEDAINRLKDLKDFIENIWVIGGSSVYKEAMESPLCYRLYITRIKSHFDCDTFFPPITKKFKIVNEDNVPKGLQDENGIQYEFVIFEKEM